MARKPPKFDRGTEVRAIARERIGAVPSARPLAEKDVRKRPKHKKKLGDPDQE